MNRLPYFIENVTHYCKGGQKAPKPPLPPVPTTAADNLAKSQILSRQKMARGFSSTILGGYQAQLPTQPSTILKSLLGE